MTARNLEPDFEGEPPSVERPEAITATILPEVGTPPGMPGAQGESLDPNQRLRLRLEAIPLVREPEDIPARRGRLGPPPERCGARRRLGFVVQDDDLHALQTRPGLASAILDDHMRAKTESPAAKLGRADAQDDGRVEPGVGQGPADHRRGDPRLPPTRRGDSHPSTDQVREDHRAGMLLDADRCGREPVGMLARDVRAVNEESGRSRD